MKTRKPINISADKQLYNLFKDVFADEDEINEAVRDAKKAFTLIQHDVLYKKGQQ